jgi:hypothetical protein
MASHNKFTNDGQLVAGREVCREGSALARGAGALLRLRWVLFSAGANDALGF